MVAAMEHFFLSAEVARANRCLDSPWIIHSYGQQIPCHSVRLLGPYVARKQRSRILP